MDACRHYFRHHRCRKMPLQSRGMNSNFSSAHCLADDAFDNLLALLSRSCASIDPIRPNPEGPFGAACSFRPLAPTFQYSVWHGFFGDTGRCVFIRPADPGCKSARRPAGHKPYNVLSAHTSRCQKFQFVTDRAFRTENHSFAAPYCIGGQRGH